MDTVTFRRLGPMVAAMAMAIIIVGNAMNRSVSLITTSSNQPLKKAARVPRTIPIAAERTTVRIGMPMSTGKAATILESKSLPSRSVPNTCVRDGGRFACSKLGR